MKLYSKALLLLLTIAMLTTALVFPVSAKHETVKADGFDTFRGAGMLIIYTTNMGETTNTNEWGYEVIIENNVAVKYNKGNSTIPRNGFVLSGHNAGNEGKNMGKWIQDNIAIGDYVYYSPDGVVTVSDTPISDSIFYDLTQNVHGFNTIRNTNQLIIYNKAGTHTGTNEWGYEVVCTNGVVTVMGGNNSLVPTEKNSFVVSGHGDSVTWLQNNVKLGMSVSYDATAKTVTFSFDDAAATAGMKMLVPELRDKYEAAKKRYDYIDYSEVNKAINELDSFISSAIKSYKNDKDGDKLVAARSKAEEMKTKAELLISESRTVQYRGAWIRPTDTSPEQVDQTVQKLYDNGINLICIETLYSCTMIMPMPKGSLFETNPKFKHFDLLQAYVDACHKRDMELHLWMPIYYVGDAGSSNAKASLGTKKPEWLSISNTGKHSYEVNNELGGLMMLDPSNEEASNYLLNTYKYILETYDVDGFQLDYIRYYDRGTDYDMGYTKEALDAFEAKYGVRPKYDTKASYWNDWVQFRCDYINNFVARVRKLIDDVRPGVLLGADVVPDPSKGYDHNYQNYYNWLQNKWIDILFPMAYGYGYDDAIIQQTERCGETAFISVGLGAFVTEFGPTDMQAQASFSNSANTDGATFFEATAYLNKFVGEYLLQGVYRNRAITPTIDVKKAAIAQTEYAKGRINDILIPQGGISSANGAKVISAFDELAASFTDEGFDSEKYNAVKTAIEDSKAKDGAKTRMLSDLLFTVKGYTVLNKELDLSDLPEIPEISMPSEDEVSDESADTSLPEETESSTPSDESEPATSGEKSDDTVAIIIIISVTVLIVAALIYFGLIKKGKN